MSDETQIVEYDITVAAIEEMKQKYSGLKITDAKSDKAVRAARTFMVSKRTAVEKKRVELNASANEWRNKVNAKAKEITALLLPIEEPLQAECKRVDDEIKARKAEKDRKERERIEAIQAKINGIRHLGGVYNLASSHIEERLIIVKGMQISQDVYMEFTNQAIQLHKESISAIEEALAERLQFEKEEENRKAEAERLEAQRKEQAEAQAKIDEGNRKVREGIAKLEADRKTAEETKEREEFERKAREEADKSAKARAQQAEQDRIEREEAQAKEKARQETLRPDKEKLLKWIRDFNERIIPIPQLNSKKANKIMKTARENIEMVLQEARDATEEL